MRQSYERRMGKASLHQARQLEKAFMLLLMGFRRTLNEAIDMEPESEERRQSAFARVLLKDASVVARRQFTVVSLSRSPAHRQIWSEFVEEACSSDSSTSARWEPSAMEHLWLAHVNGR